MKYVDNMYYPSMMVICNELHIQAIMLYTVLIIYEAQ